MQVYPLDPKFYNISCYTDPFWGYLVWGVRYTSNFILLHFLSICGSNTICQQWVLLILSLFFKVSTQWVSIREWNQVKPDLNIWCLLPTAALPWVLLSGLLGEMRNPEPCSVRSQNLCDPTWVPDGVEPHSVKQPPRPHWWPTSIQTVGATWGQKLLGTFNMASCVSGGDAQGVFWEPASASSRDSLFGWT